MANFQKSSQATKAFVGRSLLLSKLLCSLSLLFPLLTVSGWVLNIPLLTRGHPELPAMVPNTALGLVLGASAFFLAQNKSRPKSYTFISGIFSVMILLFGILTLSEYVFGWDMGIDQIFTFGVLTTDVMFPGRPSPQTSFNFILLGISLISLNFQSIPGQIGRLSAILMGTNAFVAATGYIFSTKQFYGFPFYGTAIGMAIHTSAGFILQTGALLFCRPTEGFLSLVTSDTRSGGMARKIFFSILGLPLLVGFITKIGVVAGWYDVGIQVSLFTVVIIGLIVRSTWSATKQADTEEIQARIAQEETLRANERLNRALEEREIFAELIENSSDFIGIADANGKPIFVNQAGRSMVGLPADYPVENTQILEYYPLEQRSLVTDVILKAMLEKGQWKGETFFRNWQTEESIPVSDDHFMIREKHSNRILGMGTVTRDITMQKNLEAALRLSEAKASGIVSTSADAIISIDDDQNITMFNEGAEKIFGYSKAEAIGQSLNILLPKRIREIHRQHMENFAEGKQVARRMGERGGVIFGLRKNGEEFPADAAISKLEVGGKRILTVSLRDMSAQKRIENEQRFLAEVGSTLASTLDYESTLDHIVQLAVRDIADLCVVYVFDERGEIRRSKAVSRDSGKAWVCDLLMSIPLDRTRSNPIDSVLETKQSLLVEKVSADMIESIADSHEHLKALRAADLESFIISPLVVYGKLLGAISFVTSSTSRHFDSGDLYLVEELARRAAVAIDNSQLHREARQAKLIADNVPAMMAYWDKDQRCQFANRAYLDWFNFDPQKLIGRTMLDLMGPVLYEKNLPYITSALRGERQNFERELKKQSTSEVRHTSAQYIPEKINGKVLGFFVLVFDVTDLKRAQLAALEQERKALDAVQTREDILAIVSHDLKNPLASIGLSAQLLQRMTQIDRRQISDFAERVQRSVDQMQTLIGDLLDFGKIQAGLFSVEKFRESPMEVILPIADGVKVLAEAKRQHLEVEIASALPDVACDSFRIGQVLSNLLGNAIKFTPAGGTIRLIVTQSKNEILVSVSDTGPGIPPENLSKIFDRYWQAQETKKLGSGLGLSIAKGVIEAHGTKIWAESDVGRGSCFSFTIPLATPETKKKPVTEQSSPVADLDSLEGTHIVVVDDSPDNLSLMRLILQKAGARVTVAGSVKDALKEVSRERPDLIITDIEMPDGDGYELIAKVHQMDKSGDSHLPVAALTAHTEENELRKISKAGFDASFSKPINSGKVISSIRGLINRGLLH